MEFCPACVNDFLKNNKVYDLRDEVFDLNHPSSTAEFGLCDKHKGRMLIKEMRKAREVTKPRFDEIMAMKVEPSRPSQNS